MLSFLKKDKQPKDVKTLRSDLLDFIKDQLKKAEGEGADIKGMHLYINCHAQDKFLYESAVYINDTEQFREEIQRIADDFDISLHTGWQFQVFCEEEVPPEAIQSASLDAAIFISTRQRPAIRREAIAYLKVLNGEAEQAVYTLTSSGKKINIGREKNVQVADGYLRQNHIAFTDSSSNKSNKSISRRHAHIEWNEELGAFFLYADEGGIPPANKVKVKPEKGAEVKLITTEVGYHLKEGDQVILGESALLEFSYSE
ncbi:FHA domain-containing protein [Parafilimonas sp.]|uniref:FHA domain-containing protein n=1 Tax=Parafilimonas sp. TaxID=1969739 RepID=UPI0039E3CBBD